MKDKIKDSIFIVSIVYSIIIISLMLFSYSTSVNTVEFNDDSENIKILNQYKENLKDIGESTCKSSLNNLINHYEKTSYNGKVNLKDKIMDEDFVLKYAAAIIKDCNLNDETRSSVALKMLTSSIQFDEVLQRLYFQYEIKIPDLNNRLIMEPSMDGIRYNINRKNQLEAIKMIIDVLEGESKYE